ncbi:MAG: alpha/beta hydrolase [Ruminococcaceae bacterium]|nr:alpha/beta hydrolase [Oscillospiraceae bacterium]
MVLVFIIPAVFFLTLAAVFCKVFYSPHAGQNNPEVALRAVDYSPHAPRVREAFRELEATPYERVYIRSRDGLRLTARYYHTADGAPLAIQVHGYRSHVLRDFSGDCLPCQKRGFNVLLIEQRAHGESEGHCICFGIREKYDVIDWANYAAARFPGVKILLSGLSMGASTVLMAAAEEELPANVRGISFDCGYSSVKAIICHQIQKMGLPVKPAYFLTRLSARLFGGFDPNDGDVLAAAKNCRVPALFIHGEADDFVPWAMGRALYEACPTAYAFISVPGASHGLAYMEDTPRCVNALESFADFILQETETHS